mgnify:CR=1 FL=1
MTDKDQKIIKVDQVALKVSDLNKSIAFYEEVIGLRVRKRDKNYVHLSADGENDLLLLRQPENPVAPPPGATGLYHSALLLPGRADLADFWLHLQNHRQWLKGASDHSVSEAIYLEDPDGNGLEIYSDREDEQVETMGTERLDVEELLEQATDTPWERLPGETVMGHIHLKVKDLEEAIAFYRDTIGLQLMRQQGSSAAFMATGGYHHHIALNTWESQGGSPPPEEAVGLEYALISVPDQKTLDRIIDGARKETEVGKLDQGDQIVKDPSGIALRFRVRDDS